MAISVVIVPYCHCEERSDVAISLSLAMRLLFTVVLSTTGERMEIGYAYPAKFLKGLAFNPCFIAIIDVLNGIVR